VHPPGLLLGPVAWHRNPATPTRLHRPGYTDPARRSGRQRGDHLARRSNWPRGYETGPIHLAYRWSSPVRPQLTCPYPLAARAGREAMEPVHRLASLFGSAVWRDGRVQPPGSPLGLATQHRTGSTHTARRAGRPCGDMTQCTHPLLGPGVRPKTRPPTWLAAGPTRAAPAPRAPIRLVARAGPAARNRGPPTWLAARPNPCGHTSRVHQSGPLLVVAAPLRDPVHPPGSPRDLAARSDRTQVHSLVRSTRPA
jgi:hypothetical protein